MDFTKIIRFSHFIVVFFVLVDISICKAQNFIPLTSTLERVICEPTLIKTNKIKNIYVFKHSPGSKNAVNKGKPFVSFLFDPNGNILEKRQHTYTGNEGPFYFKWQFLYNKQGKPQETRFTKSYDSTLITYEYYTYSKKGKKANIKLVNTEGGQKQERTTHELGYDKKGNVLKVQVNESDSIISFTQTHTYNEIGKKTKVLTEWGKWKLEEVQPARLASDSGEQLSSDAEHKKPVYVKRANNKAPSEMLYNYNEKGQLTEVVSRDDINDKNLGYRLIFKYDEKGQIIRMEQTRLNGDVFYAEEYIYNQKGELLEMKEFNQNGKWVMDYKLAYTHL